MLSAKSILGGRVALTNTSLSLHYHAQMDHYMHKWDKHDNEGVGDEVIDTCH